MKGSSEALAVAPESAVRGARRRLRTRTALISAGQSLFANRPMDSVTIDDIVEAADVAKGSFYNHFEDKEGLAIAVSDQVHNDCEAEIAQANAGIDDPAARVVRALCVMVAYADTHPEKLQALLSLSERRTIASTPLNAGVSSDIARGLASGRFVGVTVEAGVVVVIGLVRTTLAHAIAEASPTPAAELTQVVGAALLRALGVTEPTAGELAREAVCDLLSKGFVR